VNDSRKEDRLPVALVMRYREPTMLEPREGQCQNLSPGGMCLLTPKPSPRGALLRFECISGGGAEAIRGTARVVWQRSKSGPRGQAGMGVRFVRLEPGGREALESLLGQLAGSVPPKPRNRPSDRQTTMVIAPTPGSGVTQQGMGAARLRTVHYPTLRGVPAATAVSPASRPSSPERAGRSAASRDTDAEVTGSRSTRPETKAAAHSPFPPTPSSPPPAVFVPSANDTLPSVAGQANGTGPPRERLDRTRRGMPGPDQVDEQAAEAPTLELDPRDDGTQAAASGDKRARDPSSDRPAREASRGSDRPPPERKSERPPRPGGVDDLRATPVPSAVAAGASTAERMKSPALGESSDGRRPLRMSEGSRASPALLIEADGRPRRSRWLAGVVIGSGVLFSWVVVQLFGSMPAGVPVEVPAEGQTEQATQSGVPDQPPGQQPAGSNPAAAAVAQVPAPARLHVVEVSSVPTGARMSALGKSVVAPGSLELGELSAPAEVTAELDGYETAKLTVAPNEFADRGDRHVRQLAFSLEPIKATTEKARPPSTRAAPKPAVVRRARPSSSAATDTPRIAQPPVPIEPPAPTPAAASSAASAAPAAPSPPPANDKPGATEPSQLDRALECLARGDNNCVIEVLEGHARSERELVILIETHLALGNSIDAERHMNRYLSAYPDGKSAAKYKRWLERRELPAEPSPP